MKTEREPRGNGAGGRNAGREGNGPWGRLGCEESVQRGPGYVRPVFFSLNILRYAFCLRLRGRVVWCRLVETAPGVCSLYMACCRVCVYTECVRMCLPICV